MHGVGFPHEMPHATEYGRSPGNGVTPAVLSREPLATEGEATPGPDHINPYDDFRQGPRTLAADPTAGDDPYVFDDVGAEVGRFDLPGLDRDPMLPF